MAELVLMTGARGGYEDGDILHAHNDAYLLWQHTQSITDHRKVPGGFFKPIDCMACKRLEAVSQYKFQRISRTEIKRITLSDMGEETLSATPNVKNEAIDVPEFIARRKAGGKLPMFGSEDSVIWFGGHTSLTKLSELWTDVITPETGLLEADHKQKTNYSHHFLKRYLVVVTTDFDEVRRGIIENTDVEYTNPGDAVLLAKRRHKVDWRNMSGMSAKTIADIEDTSVKVDVKRDVIRTESTIVEVKIK